MLILTKKKEKCEKSLYLMDIFRGDFDDAHFYIQEFLLRYLGYIGDFISSCLVLWMFYIFIDKMLSVYWLELTTMRKEVDDSSENLRLIWKSLRFSVKNPKNLVV